ncbi:MAG: ParB/RepB/Spo0J family partition protein [Waterburya sp.]
MKVRKGNNQLSELAKTYSSSANGNSAHIPISSVIIKPWLQELIRPRTPSEEANLKADIEINGLSTPIVLTTIDGEDNCLVDGHGRLECYQQLQRSTIPFTVKTFNNRDEICAWVYRKQLGRRNLTKQDRAYLIGSLPDSKAQIAQELEIGTTQVADARKYYKAVNWLVENQHKNKHQLLDASISSVIQLYKKLSAQVPCTESVQMKKAVNWKLDSTLVSRLQDFAHLNQAKSISQQVESIIKEYLDHHAH